jgi:uncharacterized membrane protein YgcG
MNNYRERLLNEYEENKLRRWSSNEILSNEIDLDDLNDFDAHYAEDIHDLYDYDEEERAKMSKCGMCSRSFFWVDSKEELIDCIQREIDERKPFALELNKLRHYIHLPSDKYIYLHESRTMGFICDFCGARMEHGAGSDRRSGNGSDCGSGSGDDGGNGDAGGERSKRCWCF